MRERVVITGIGCVSSFGVGVQAFTDAVHAGTSGIDPITAFDTSACRSHRAATIKGFDPTAFVAPLKLRRVDEVGRLALVCARLALEDAGRVASPEGCDDIGVALGTYTAGLDSTVAYLRGLVKDGAAGVPALLFSNTVSNAPASLCAIEFGLRGPNLTFNQREASSLAALVFATGAIRDGRAAGFLTGGADRLEETFFKVHDRFRALSPGRAGGPEAARPFDRRRNGYVLGEGGFVVLIESFSSARRRDAPMHGEILGVGASASPTPINAWPRDPAGPARAMQLALSDADLRPEQVDAIFAAANGSIELDTVEASAIAAAFGPRRVPVTSLKGALGESGAAGGANLIAGLASLSSGFVPSTPGWSEPDPRCDVSVSRLHRPIQGDVFVVNSIASGGTNYALVARALGHRRELSDQL